MDKLDIKEPLETWDDEMLNKVVSGFLDERFPTVVAMNKIDLADSDKNISKIMRKYDQTKLVLTSALAENFLKKMQKQGYIKYIEGTDIVETKEELVCFWEGVLWICVSLAARFRPQTYG
ncbi:hypothetical protein BC938DRAFT_472812 [Jimgerdemannia flammicorona]|uniref:Obg-like GTPase YGR210-like G4 motif-containing domain-containing protein n=1 Tax=Jimgerdemannia flammicorona TaxID=994334 RepID=A0A433Q5C0_9FUNG|nr:hypothetical protein BC938DRAFT_472812 [Jimgerdemannia flammicorona]